MKAVRTPLATALAGLVIMLIGCGPLIGPEPGPGAPGFSPEPGPYDDYVWVSINSTGGQAFVTTDAGLDLLEFVPISDDEPILVDSDMTIRAYVIDARGLRSPIAEAAYTITTADTIAPTVSSPVIQQANVSYLDYDIQWDAWEGDPSGDGDPNPSDDVTGWYELEFAVYASPQDNIDTLVDAESNGTLLKDWHSESMDGGVGFAKRFASRAGERRYINVFVRDRARNASAYGSVLMESRLPPPDIYLGRMSPPADEVWLNPFEGTFAPVFANPPNPPPALLRDTHAVAFADLNDDGFDDLIACYGDGGTDYQAWFAAVGNGTFSDTPNYFEVDSDVATDIEIADMNQDGSPDVIFANGVDGGIDTAVYSASGSLLFTVPTTDTDLLAVGDINGDGYPDIVTGDTDGGDGVQVWINTAGTGVVEAVQTWTGPDHVTDPLDVHLADLDGDGDADLLVASASVPAQVYYSDGDSSLVPAVEIWADKPYLIETADWDGNGWLDLIFANDIAVAPWMDTRIFLSDGAYGFGAPLSAALGLVPLDIVVADFNDDGWPDFVQTFVGNPLQVWLNDGAGGVIAGFAPATGGDGVIAVGRLR